LRFAQVPPIQDFEQSHNLEGPFLPNASVNSTVAGLIRITKPMLDRMGMPIDNLLLVPKLLGLTAASCLILFFVFPRKFFYSPPLYPSDVYLAFVGIVAVNVVEYVIPYRAAYADIYYLLPVMLGIPVISRRGSVWLGVLLLTALASQQNLLGLVHAWYAIPVRIVGLTLFSIGALFCCRDTVPNRTTDQFNTAL
jgi:hypothetical protein